MLNLDPATIVFQIINFIVLAVLLNRFLFQPILRQAAQRAEEKEQLMKGLAAERQEVALLRAELEQKHTQIEEEAARVVEESRERAEAERGELLTEARLEAERVLVEAQTDALRLQQQAATDFQEQLVTAVLDISGNVILRVAPQEAHDTLVQGLSERIRDLGREEMQRVEALRRSLGTREPVAYVTSARELSAEQQGQLARIFTALADRHVNIELRTDPTLVAGLRVRLGDTVMDNSIAGQLHELRDEVLGTLKGQFSDV
jgi:F-type H+-transporting ATPase subunit b